MMSQSLSLRANCVSVDMVGKMLFGSPFGVSWVKARSYRRLHHELARSSH
jgi:hypothetical protein